MQNMKKFAPKGRVVEYERGLKSNLNLEISKLNLQEKLKKLNLVKSMNYIIRHFLMQCNTHMTMQRKSWVSQ